VPLTVAQRAWQEETDRWLADFVEAVVELRPSRAQLLALIEVVGFLLSVMMFLSSYTTVDLPEAQLAGAGLLLQGGARLYRAVEGADSSE
jgi:hypothetical protein